MTFCTFPLYGINLPWQLLVWHSAPPASGSSSLTNSVFRTVKHKIRCFKLSKEREWENLIKSTLASECLLKETQLQNTTRLCKALYIDRNETGSSWSHLPPPSSSCWSQCSSSESRILFRPQPQKQQSLPWTHKHWNCHIKRIRSIKMMLGEKHRQKKHTTTQGQTPFSSQAFHNTGCSLKSHYKLQSVRYFR